MSQVFDAEQIESARILFARQADFLMGAAAIEQLPAPIRKSTWRANRIRADSISSGVKTSVTRRSGEAAP